MSERSTYLRNQADKCRWHANNIGDAETQAEVRKLAAAYVERAFAIEQSEMINFASSAKGTDPINTSPA